MTNTHKHTTTQHYPTPFFILLHKTLAGMHFFVPSDICLLETILSRYARTNFPTFPRSYCHPTQPILQIHSHILLKIRLCLPSNHTTTHSRASSLWAVVWLYDRWNLSFSIKYARSLAYVRFFLYLCTHFLGNWKVKTENGKVKTENIW